MDWVFISADANHVSAIARCVDDLKPTRNNAEDPVLVASLDQEHDLLYNVLQQFCASEVY